MDIRYWNGPERCGVIYVVKGCYYCGVSGKKLTKDHIPPKGFFKRPLPPNLLTAKCCEDCHRAFSKDDNDLRAWFVAVGTRSEDKNWVREPVFRDLKKNEKLRADLASRLNTIRIERDGVVYHLPGLYQEPVAIDRFLTRITKGLLSKFYPAYDYFGDQFHVHQLPPDQEGIETYRTVVSHCRYDSRGKDAFQFWHRLTSDGLAGAWVFIFYQGLCFMVTHDHAGEL